MFRKPRLRAPRYVGELSARARRIALVALAGFVVAAGVAGGLVATSGPGPRQITAYFTEAVGVYPGSDVDVLGVKVGTIDSVQPDGKLVRVVMSVDSSVAVPAGVDAVVIVPSVIADRYIQLSPPYIKGAQLASNATIPSSRTATPVEIDQLYSSIAKFAQDLGPNGVNSKGALSNVINTGAANLKGNGKDLGTMIRELSQLYQTLHTSQGNFFGTLDNLNAFSKMLESNNSQVKTVESQLAQVSTFLAADRTELSGALSELTTALTQVRSFISDNRSALKANISKLETITKLLVNQRNSLAEALDNEPLAADNFLGAYDPATGTLDARGNLLELENGKCNYFTNPDQKGCPTLPLPASGSAQGGS